jgi:hypothetical protein
MRKSESSLKTGIIFAIFLFILTSCATTRLNSVWRDDNYSGKVKRVLVIGVIKRPAVKRFFEDEFVQQLKTRGTDAIEGFTVLPPDKEEDKDIIASKLKELGVDGVLIVRLVDKKTLETYIPGEVYYEHAPYAPPLHYREWDSYYSRSYRAVYRPGYTVKNEVVIVETNLYDAVSEKLIWSALSETFVEGSSDDLIRSFIQVIIKDLYEKGLLE